MRFVRRSVSISASTVLGVLHHGLLDVDVLSGLHRVDGDARVPVVGCRDDHRVHVRAREDFPVVARGEHVIAVQLLGQRQAAVVHVGDRDELDARHAERRARVADALDAEPDGRDLDPIGRRDLLFVAGCLRAENCR